MIKKVEMLELIGKIHTIKGLLRDNGVTMEEYDRYRYRGKLYKILKSEHIPTEEVTDEKMRIIFEEVK